MMKPNSSFRPNTPLRRLIGGTIALLGLLPASVYAQESAQREFTAQRFDPAAGPRNFFVTRTARSDGTKTWSAGFYGSYAAKPLVIVSCQDLVCDRNDRLGDLPVIKTLMAGDLLGSFSVMPPLQIGLRVPVMFVNGQGLDPVDQSMAPDGTKKMALGDPTVEGKYRFFGNLESPIAAAGAVFISAPVGHAMAKGAYIGDASPTFGLRGIADFKHRDLSAAVNLVGMWRADAKIGGTHIGPELRYSAAVGYNIGPMLKVMAEGVGNTRLKMEGDGSNGLEALLGGQFTPNTSPFTFSLGGGTRIIEGVGIPTFRVFAGLLYSAEPRDRDQDGLLDSQDSCPTVAEDRDNFEDSDGCPETDNDGDRFADSADKCPNQPEDMDGVEDTDGCPDFDDDKDGVLDEHDACRDKPETKNGFKDEDGCPDEVDNDADGVADAADKCPGEAEDTDGFEDTDGCPEPDNDKDGIPDASDECSEEPETINEFEDTDGCPDENPDPKAAKKK